MISLKAKHSRPGLESILNISDSGTFKLRFCEYRGTISVLWSALQHSFTQVVRKRLHMLKLTSCSNWCYTVHENKNKLTLRRLYTYIDFLFFSACTALCKSGYNFVHILKHCFGEDQRGNKLCII